MTKGVKKAPVNGTVWIGGGQSAVKDPIDLVFNPLGAFLPPEQGALEAEYKAKLKADFDIDFDNLFAITNAPGGRFGERLLQSFTV